MRLPFLAQLAVQQPSRKAGNLPVAHKQARTGLARLAVRLWLRSGLLAASEPLFLRIHAEDTVMARHDRGPMLTRVRTYYDKNI